MKGEQKVINSIILAVAAASAMAAPAARAPDIAGLWINADRSIEVRTGTCGALMCGWVARASPQAAADARDAGAAFVAIGGDPGEAAADDPALARL